MYMLCGRHICSGASANVKYICIPVLLVTLLIEMSLYWMDIVTYLSHVYIN